VYGNPNNAFPKVEKISQKQDSTRMTKDAFSISEQYFFQNGTKKSLPFE
jgi:hypothetical protein